MTQNHPSGNRLYWLFAAMALYCAIPDIVFAKAPHGAQASDTQRDQDDRRLDELATKYYAIKADDPQAIAKLKKLEHEVDGFRKTLSHRHYKSGDITKDARKLERRIAAQHKKLEAAWTAANNKTVSAAPVTTVSTSPVAAPTTIVQPHVSPAQAQVTAPPPVSASPAPTPLAPAPAIPTPVTVTPLPTPMPSVRASSAPAAPLPTH